MSAHGNPKKLIKLNFTRNLNPKKLFPFVPAYVKSNTVIGDAKHTAGVVMAEIVLGNIPVKNGVVHLIHRPLMIVDTTVAKFLEVRKLVSGASGKTK